MVDTNHRFDLSSVVVMDMPLVHWRWHLPARREEMRLRRDLQ